MRGKSVVVLIMVIACSASITVWADLTNGNFSAGLDGWDYVGVDASDEKATFDEAQGSVGGGVF